MNPLLKRELKGKIKSYIIWMLTISFFIFVSMFKFDTLTDTAMTNTIALMDKIPKSIMIILGMDGLDITTLGGYVGTLYVYLIFALGMLGAIQGSKSISLEEEFKTSDFLFTKPISRTKVMVMKYVASCFYLVVLNLSLYFVTLGILSKYDDNLGFLKDQFLGLLISMLFFLSLGTLLSGSKTNKHANILGPVSVLVFYLLSISMDLIGKTVNILSPFSAFGPKELSKNGLSITYVIMYLIISVILYLFSIKLFKNRDIRG